jgi:hypothetical protein
MSENAPRKQYYQCKKCKSFSRFITENGEERTGTSLFGSKRKVYGEERTDFSAVLQGFGSQVNSVPKKEHALLCLHCGEKNMQSLFSSTVPQPLLVEMLVRYARCKKCKHETLWPMSKDEYPWKRGRGVNCSNCGTMTSWDIYKEEIQKGNQS